MKPIQSSCPPACAPTASPMHAPTVERLTWQLDRLRENGFFNALISYPHHNDGTLAGGDFTRLVGLAPAAARRVQGARHAAEFSGLMPAQPAARPDRAGRPGDARRPFGRDQRPAQRGEDRLQSTRLFSHSFPLISTHSMTTPPES